MKIPWLPVTGLSTSGATSVSSIVIGVGVVASCFLGSRCWGDELKLRTGSQLQDIRVVSVDEDGVVLDNGKVYPLDSIQSAKLEQQTIFDELHAKISIDLFRLRVRLKRDDLESLQSELARLYPVFQNRNSRSAVVVMLAQLRQCVQQGRWEQAIDAHFRLFTLAASHADNSGELQSLGYRIDIRSGMTGEIYPGGISKANVLANWESILKSYKALPDPHPSGLDFYFFQLARIAEAEVDPELSSRRLKLTAMEQMLLETLHRAITATGAEELKLVRGQFVDQEFKTEDTPIHQAIFYLVRGLLTAKAEPENSNQGLLDLLRIHAEFGRRANSLSAAGLFHAARVFRSRDMLQAEKSVADELFTRYPSSNFTKQIKMNESK